MYLESSFPVHLSFEIENEGIKHIQIRWNMFLGAPHSDPTWYDSVLSFLFLPSLTDDALLFLVLRKNWARDMDLVQLLFKN